ncbi:MAG: hypothetical protein R3Y23_02065 [Bacillota bacterium]
MRFFRATGSSELEEVHIPANAGIKDETQAEEAVNSDIKLKMSLIMPTSIDVDIFEGKLDIDYPIVPCHVATAIASEDRAEYGIKMGNKFILNPYVLSSLGNCGDDNVERYGLDTDGFLRNFVTLPFDNVIQIPEDVKEEEALFTEFIAVALATLNSFKLNKGDYIVIIGGSILNIIIGQLALYYQAIPIFVASDPRFLDLAIKSGIYYTIDELKEDVYKKVLTITGGKLAEHTVLHSKGGVSPNFIHQLAGRGANCVLTALTPNFVRMEADISQIANKNIILQGVSCGVDEINAAVNILVQKTLKLSHLVDKECMLSEMQELFKELGEYRERYICPLIRV